MNLKMKHDRGQALVIIAIAAIGLFGIVGLAVDGSAKFSDRRHAQNAADTAALAGALEKATGITNNISNLSPTTNNVESCPPPSGVLPSPLCAAVQLAALNRANGNGYNNNLTSNTVEVRTPPISGTYANDNSYVQVIITSYVNTYLARVIGIPQTKNTVETVAYLDDGGYLADGASLVSYDPSPNCSVGGTGGYSVSVSGSSIVNLNRGGIFVNSDEVCGFRIPNCADLNIYNGTILSAGNNIDLGACTFNPTFTPKINQEAISIPDDVYWPDVPPECSQPATAYQTHPGTDEWHIRPGYYSDFPQETLNGNDITKLVGNKKDIIMDPGVYCVGKSIHWSGNTFNSLDGSAGVTIYLRSGFDFDMSINSPIKLFASNSGKYRGYVIIQEGTHTDIGSCTINGGTYLNIEGMVYAPYCDITINGGSDPFAQINAQLIGWTLKINGTTTINFNYDPSKQVRLPRRIGLMR